MYVMIKQRQHACETRERGLFKNNAAALPKESAVRPRWSTLARMWGCAVEPKKPKPSHSNPNSMMLLVIQLGLHSAVPNSLGRSGVTLQDEAPEEFNRIV